MMVDSAEMTTLAPLDELSAILPGIEKAKERARLGTALQKATITAEGYNWIPDRLQDLCKLLEAIAIDKDGLRAELRPSLTAIIKMASTLSAEPSVEELDNINQSGMVQLPLHMDKIGEHIEAVWSRCVREQLGGHAALGEVLSAIPGLGSLGGDLTRLATRARTLEDPARAATGRVAERDKLVAEASALTDRLLAAGVAPPIADFLVAVAAHPVRLSDLTEDIFTWIRDHDALSLFSVSARGA